MCIDLVNAFTTLNPFDLAHLSEILLVQLEEVLAERDVPPKLQFTQQDVKHAVICAMRILKVEMAENKLAEAQSQLHQMQREIHVENKVYLQAEE